MPPTAPNSRGKLVWDLPLRLFHWSLVAAVTGAWITHELGVAYMQAHIYCGYTALVLVGWRVVWGFTGPHYARFSAFVRGPAAAVGDLRDWLGGTARPRDGHSPLAGYGVLALLAAVAIQASSGLFNSDDILYSGPLHHLVAESTADRLSYVHGLGFNVLVALVGLHLATVLGYRLLGGIDLIGPMIHGRKPLTQAGGGPPLESQRMLLALVLFGLCAALLALGLALAPPPPEQDLGLF
jgi:cytochrome b